MRTEKDFIGERQISDEAFYGIHSVRAKENFPDNTPFHIEWYKAIGTVKKACFITYKDFVAGVLKKYPAGKTLLNLIDEKIVEAMILSASEVESGHYFDHFIVPAVSGGAGTSINMNVNEIIANVSLLKTGHTPGEYNLIDPVEQANVYQSTNDVIPTALKVAVMRLLTELETSINELRADIEILEQQNRNSLRTGYTQMQEAVPSSFGRLLSTYNDALSRDWWRVSKCFERIKVVNLGGSAIGSGITVPRFFILQVVQTLQQLTGLPITRSENMHDATSNLDSFVEVHAILKAHAVNLEKMVSDIRLLSSDLFRNKEMTIPKKQAGSSIMPAKVNPVIPEFVISVAHKVYANDNIISGLCGQGCLELNPYLPLIGHSFLESIKLLIAADKTLKQNLFNGLVINSESAYQNLIKSPSVVTALLPYIGYNKATLLANEMKTNNIDLFEANKKGNYINVEKLTEILKPENLLKEGFSLNDLM